MRLSCPFSESVLFSQWLVGLQNAIVFVWDYRLGVRLLVDQELLLVGQTSYAFAPQVFDNVLVHTVFVLPILGLGAGGQASRMTTKGLEILKGATLALDLNILKVVTNHSPILFLHIQTCLVGSSTARWQISLALLVESIVGGSAHLLL